MKKRFQTFYWKCGLFFLAAVLLCAGYFVQVYLSLPRLVTMADYKPPLLTEVYDRNNKKIGEFLKERRRLFKYEDMPSHLIEAFVSAEDGSFFAHKGLNYRAIIRAFLVNFKEGRKVQGGSTITQQVARTLLLSSEKTYTRKLKEAILALRMETVFSKQDILYIYLNQIYMGHGAYGVEMAARVYFRKSTKEISLAEAALLAGLPKAPSRFSPIHNPGRAKERQIYVLGRMLEEGYITEPILKKALAEPLKIYMREDFNSQSPYYLETVRRVLLEKISQKDLLEEGLQIFTAMDLDLQKAAQKSLARGLEALDRRQGYRGALRLIEDSEKVDFLSATAEKLKKQLKTYLIIPGAELTIEEEGISLAEDSEVQSLESDSKKPSDEEIRLKTKLLEVKGDPFSWEKARPALKGQVFEGLIQKVQANHMFVETPWGLETLALEDLSWAAPVLEKPDKKMLKDLQTVFKKNQVILVRLQKQEAKEDLKLSLYQAPLVQGALLSFDLETSDILALVGGYDYSQSEFNRAWQARRQPGSVFKPFVYAAALERGFHPASLISDAPVVFTDNEAEEKKSNSSLEDSEEQTKAWKPSNISERFHGDLLFRTALVRSLNVPTVKIIQRIGLKWTLFFARCLGLFSPLNADYTTALGSSALNLYEVSKAYSVFAKGGKGLVPLLVHRVEDSLGETLFVDLSLDEMFKQPLKEAEAFLQNEKGKWFSEKSSDPKKKEWLEIFKRLSNQRIPASQSYIMTDLLQAVISDSEGTAGRARALRRTLAGKTGTTDGFYDAWFVGYSPFMTAGVWVGFDEEKSLGKGEAGSRAALPLWMDYMKAAHKDLPDSNFSVPDGIVFVNVDEETGTLPSPETKEVVRQAFVEGTEPTAGEADKTENLPNEQDFLKQDLTN